MRIRGMLIGLVVFFVVIGFCTLLGSCTFKDSTDQKMTQDGLKTTTERIENVEVDLEPDDVMKKMLWIQGV